MTTGGLQTYYAAPGLQALRGSSKIHDSWALVPNCPLVEAMGVGDQGTWV